MKVEHFGHNFRAIEKAAVISAAVERIACFAVLLFQIFSSICWNALFHFKEEGFRLLQQSRQQRSS